MSRHRERSQATAAYPDDFTQWAHWQIDFSITAPSYDVQMATLFKEWTQRQQPLGEREERDG